MQIHRKFSFVSVIEKNILISNIIFDRNIEFLRMSYDEYCIDNKIVYKIVNLHNRNSIIVC